MTTRLTLKKPAGRLDPGVRKHFLDIQNELERHDKVVLKIDDRIERTRRQVNEVATTYTIGTGDDVVLCDTTSAAFTVTLPPVADDLKVLSIKNIGSGGNALTVDGNASETVDTLTSIVLSDLEAVRLQSDGVEWWIL